MSFLIPADEKVVPYLPPCKMFSDRDQKWFILPYWIELDESDPEGHMNACRENFERVKNEFRKRVGLDEDPNSPKMEWKVKDYIITLNKGSYTCTCKGFQFRRKCKHIEQVKNEH